MLIRDKHFEWGEDENEVVLGHNGYGADVVAVVKLDDIEEKGSTKLSIPEQTSAEYELLSHENEDLRKQVEALKSAMKLTKGHKVKPEAVKKLTNKILREYNSKVDKNEISTRLEHIFKICRRRKRAGFLHNNFYLKTKIECSQLESVVNTRYGRSDRVRTCGLNIPNVARYQLRHTPKFIFSRRLSCSIAKQPAKITI